MLLIDPTAALNGKSVDEMHAYFARYPSSEKPAIVQCPTCGTERKIKFNRSHGNCQSCAATLCAQNPETSRLKSIKRAAYWKRPGSKERFVESMTPHYTSDAYKAAQRDSKIEYWADPDNRAAQSDRINSSYAHAVASEVMRGGSDIVSHHTLYDHDDLSLNTYLMTRSQHASLHSWLRSEGISVEHINQKVDA